VTGAQRRTVKKHDLAQLLEAPEQEFHFSEGLLGFPTYQRFSLAPFRPGDGSPSPFYILTAPEEAISFPVIQPELVLRHYRPNFSREVFKRLKAKSMADLLVFVIATLRGRVEDITVNLAGPLLLNPASRLGLQVVLDSYPVRYPLVDSQSY
jgi:flagellar assembly factor FliW